jgi:hypothetical protein
MLQYRFIMKFGENNQIERLIADHANVEFTKLSDDKIIIKVNEKYFEIKVEETIHPNLGMYERPDLAEANKMVIEKIGETNGTND